MPHWCVDRFGSRGASRWRASFGSEGAGPTACRCDSARPAYVILRCDRDRLELVQTRGKAHRVSYVRCQVSAYRQVHRGMRFSANAVGPSLASALPSILLNSAVFTAHIGAPQSEPKSFRSAIIRLLVVTARVALREIFFASCNAAGRTLSGEVTTLTRPHSSAACAGIGSPVSNAAAATFREPAPADGALPRCPQSVPGSLPGGQASRLR